MPYYKGFATTTNDSLKGLRVGAVTIRRVLESPSAELVTWDDSLSAHGSVPALNGYEASSLQVEQALALLEKLEDSGGHVLQLNLFLAAFL